MKKIKYILTVVALVVLTAVLAVSVGAEEHGEVIDSGECGDNLTWVLYEDGLLEIDGTGEMENYSSTYSNSSYYTTAPWGKHLSELKTLKLNEGILSIGEDAFRGIGFTGSLIIPESVTSIGVRAFGQCSGFTGSLIIPNSVTSIEEQAFSGCSGFTGNLTIPDSVTLIGEWANRAFFHRNIFL